MFVIFHAPRTRINVHGFHIFEQIVNIRKNISKIWKQKRFTAKSRNIFIKTKGSVKTACGGLIVEPCSVAYTMNLGTTSHGNGVIFPENPPCFCGHFVDWTIYRSRSSSYYTAQWLHSNFRFWKARFARKNSARKECWLFPIV